MKRSESILGYTRIYLLTYCFGPTRGKRFSRDRNVETWLSDMG